MEKDTRQLILDTAKKEFARHGLEGARIDLIAAHAEVNKAMIYYYFHSKENLYQTVIDSHVEEVGNFLEESMAGISNPEDIFQKLAEFYNNVISSKDTFLPIMLREVAGGGERVKNALTNVFFKRGLSSKLKKLIDDGIKTSRFRNVDSKNAAISFIGMNMFYLIFASAMNAVWEIKDEKKFRQQRAKEVVDLFLYGLKVR
jgi:AcrR family transcriptional regulator